MGTTLRVSAHLRLPVPAERVWQVAMDTSRQGEWIPATRVSGEAGLGASVRARTGLGPLAFTDTMEVTEWEPPRRCVVRHVGTVVRGTGTFEVIPLGDLTEFAWTERLDLPGVPLAGPIARLVVAPVARQGLAMSLRRLARLL